MSTKKLVYNNDEKNGYKIVSVRTRLEVHSINERITKKFIDYIRECIKETFHKYSLNNKEKFAYVPDNCKYKIINGDIINVRFDFMYNKNYDDFFERTQIIFNECAWKICNLGRICPNVKLIRPECVIK
ncbi:MAG: hypothetical protein ACOC1L_04015 [Bacillota bacterium]